MINTYWQNRSTIPATLSEKEELLQYEIWMFRETCNWLSSSSKSQYEQNLSVESLAIHTRILVDFFYPKRRYDNDIVAQDFMPRGKDWTKIRPPITQILYDAREKANKQLAHLSRWRLKLEREGKKGWDWFKISNDMENVIGKFEQETGKN